MAERFVSFVTLYGDDGDCRTPYLTRLVIGRLRLHIFHRGDADPDPHDHPWDFWTFPLTAYVEDVTVRKLDALAGDHDPWSPRVLRSETSRQVVPAFRWSFRAAEHTHWVLGRFGGEYLHDWVGRQRTDEPLPLSRPGRIVTIVWTGGARRRWGFLKHRDGSWCWVHWRDYVFGGGKHAPCEPSAEGRKPAKWSDIGVSAVVGRPAGGAGGVAADARREAGPNP